MSQGAMLAGSAEIEAAAWYVTPQELLRRPFERGIAIDPPHPDEVDDAINVISKGDGSYRAYVHIADAGLIDPQSALTEEARHKGWSVYDGDRQWGSGTNAMLPPKLSKDKLSLNVDHYGLGAPAVTISFDVDRDKLSDPSSWNTEIYKSRIACRAMDYYDFDRLYRYKEKKPVLIANAARILTGEEVIEPSGEQFLGSVALDAVKTFMVTANHLIALEMQNNGIPWLYRYHSHRHTSSETLSESALSSILDSLGIAQYSTQPFYHDGLSLTPYSHFTSPLRRFADLANHMNLHAMMEGGDLPFPETSLNTIAAELATLTAVTRQVGSLVMAGQAA